MLDALTDFARNAVTTLGYPGILVAMVAENLFPPIPSEIVLPLAGYEVSQGNLTFLLAVLAATAGSLIGALALYAVGRFGGRPAIDRWGRVLRVTQGDVDRAERWFERWGDWVVLVSRMVPLARSVVSIPAGILEMGLPRFVVLTTIGSMLWNILLIGAGYQLGNRWEDVAHLVGDFSDAMKVVTVLAVIAAGIWLWRRRRTPAPPSRPA
jgi:membrane protein DedA with SNARE-associated domain